MAKVAKSQEPMEWKSWAISRADFVTLLTDLSSAVADGPDEHVELRIDVHGYERPFESVAEFMENVDEDEWRELSNLDVRLSTGSYPDRLHVWLDMRTYALGRATVRVSGGDRRARNGLEPDLREVMERYTRAGPTRRRVAGFAGAAYGVAASILGIAFAVVLRDSSYPLVAQAAFGMLVGLGLVTWPIERTLRYVLAVVPDVELLPTTGESRWARERQRLQRIGRTATAAVIALCTVAGTVFAAIAAF